VFAEKVSGARTDRVELAKVLQGAIPVLSRGRAKALRSHLPVKSRKLHSDTRSHVLLIKDQLKFVMSELNGATFGSLIVSTSEVPVPTLSELAPSTSVVVGRRIAASRTPASPQVERPALSWSPLAWVRAADGPI
jgi:hypothetical protein